jgi:nitrogen regulatory protein P-II 1
VRYDLDDAERDEGGTAMKEIKAYIQRYCVNKVVDALEKAGAPGITIVEVHPVGYGYDPNYFEPQFEDAFKRYGYLSIVKLEVVCADRDVERLVQAIQENCCTNSKGDGMIFVADVSTAVRIRNGARDEEAL